MKEASGEASLTVITIVLIGVIAAAGAVLIPQLLTQTEKNACVQNGGTMNDNGECVYN